MITITKGITETTVNGLHELYVCPKSVNTLPEKIHSGIYIDKRFFRSGDIFITHRFKDRTEDEFKRALETRLEFEHFCNRVVNIVRVLEDIVPISEDMIQTIISKEKQGIIRKEGDWLPASSVLTALSLPSDNIPRLYKNHRKLYDYGLEYLMSRKRSRHSFKLFEVFLRQLLRLECFQQALHPKKGFSLDIDELSVMHLDSIRDFARNEYELSIKYPKQMEQANDKVNEMMPRITHPVARKHQKDSSVYTMQEAMNLLYWLTETRKENHNLAFRSYEIGYKVKTGDIPEVISQDIKILSKLNLSDIPFYDMMRDLFIFQCQTGCRFKDMRRMTIENFNGTYLNYDPKRLMLRKFPAIAHIKLSKLCKQIIIKHSMIADNGHLFFCPHQIEYERILRDIFARAGLNRKVSCKMKGIVTLKYVPICECVTSESAEQYFHKQRSIKKERTVFSNADTIERQDAAKAALLELLD